MVRTCIQCILQLSGNQVANFPNWYFEIQHPPKNPGKKKQKK
tara:strand:+ start:1480 stop:1605 length:126 start_codon:yes stop_codon:yes gene_type:complete